MNPNYRAMKSINKKVAARLNAIFKESNLIISKIASSQSDHREVLDSMDKNKGF